MDNYQSKVEINSPKPDISLGKVNINLLMADTSQTPSMSSFKVLSECPVIVALYFSMHRNNSAQSVGVLVPLMISTILLRPKAANNGTKKEMYADLKSLQVKVYPFSLDSFLYRIYSPHIP